MSRDTFAHDYPPAAWTADGIAAALREHPPEFGLPTYADADAWERLAADEVTAPVVGSVLDRAADRSGEPVPRLPASLYLDYERTGNRTRYETPVNERVERLATFALAECVQREGRYLDDVLDYAWALCEQSTWLLPAHLGDDRPGALEGLPVPVADGKRKVALRTAGTARTLAELDHVLGDRLHPALAERIRAEVDRRVLTPYEAREDFPWFDRPTNNWNAVCNAGVVTAALHLLEDPDRQARIAAKAARSLEAYLADFDPDGCTAEGIGYWNYGFGNYVQLAATLEARTGGEYSLLSPPVVADIATYPLKVELTPGRFVPFSDADEDSTVDPFAASWLGRRLDLEGVGARGRRAVEDGVAVDDLGDTVRALQWATRVPPEWTVPTPPARDYFSGYDWWLARVDPGDPDAPVVAAKGGHNDESHNHNDLGSFVYHAGRESLLTDLGSPVYDRDFFSDRRYEYLVARSLGHSVPLVNGTEQAPGAEHAATVLDRTDGETDTFAVELAGAYPRAAGLESLVRTFRLRRPSGRLLVADEAAFDGGDNDLVEVLVSYFPTAATDDGVVVTGESGTATVTVDPPPAGVDVERVEAAVRGRDVWRARIDVPVDGDSVAATLSVVPGDSGG